MCLVPNTAPDIKAEALFPDGTVKELKLADYRGKYVVLFFYPADFSPICPAELVHFNNKFDEFKKRNCEIIAASVDDVESHLKWTKTPLANGGIGQVRYPIISDTSREITKKYGIIHPENNVALRGLFLIDREGNVKHQVINDLPLTRSIDDTIRSVDALITLDEHGLICPPDWKRGEVAFEPNDEGVRKYLSHFDESN